MAHENRGRPRKPANKRKEYRGDAYYNKELYDWIMAKCEKDHSSYSQFMNRMCARMKDLEEQGKGHLLA